MVYKLLILMKMGMFLYKEVSLTIGKALSTIHPLINSLKNDYLDEEENDIINNITVKNPTNIKVLIAVPKNYQQIVIWNKTIRIKFLFLIL